MTADPLAVFWRHLPLVRRYSGAGAAGPTYGQPVAERGNVAVKNQIVRDSSGDEIVSSASISFPSTVAYIPPGSEVTLPAQFGSCTSQVVAVSVSDAGPPFPDTQVIYLE